MIQPLNNKLERLSFSAKTRVEETDNDKHSSLLWNRINCNCKNFMIQHLNYKLLCLSFSAKTRVEVTANEKHSSLPWYEINCYHKKHYDTAPPQQ